ncbi:MAG: ABC transporter ATP-binding protein [Bacteroidota bacterium]
MSNRDLLNIIRECARLLDQDYNSYDLNDIDITTRKYDSDEALEFKRDLIEAGNKVRVIFLDNNLDYGKFQNFLLDVEIPIVVFRKTKEDGLVPAIIYKDKKRHFKIIESRNDEVKEEFFDTKDANELVTSELGEVIFMGVFSYKSLVSSDPENGEVSKKFSPLQRLYRLLSEEKKDILYIYIYAVVIGVVSLTLPLGIQATVELVSGGVFFSSIYVLIALVIVGVVITGALQITQITLVEYLQRRVFTKAAFEFAFRVPRIKIEALQQIHAPELMNRFFDILTIQKGLPKLLIDLSAGIIQILFGLLLLSFYHPFFVFFGIFLVGTLFLIFYFTGPKGLDSSIIESKYKYKVAFWLEELARTINSFKLSGNSELPVKKADQNINNYLKNRKQHFNILISQYSWILIFKAAVTGGLLIIGTNLVVNREITLGQFVASEVIIILTLGSVEKIIMYMDVIYDLLTAVDKIAQVTDLPLEKSGGIDFPKMMNKGFEINVKKLSYKYPGKSKPAIHDIDLHINSGEKICICGPGDAGKTTLTSTLSALHQNFEGIITYNGLSIKDLDLVNLRDKIGKNVSQEDLFDGSILENILVGKPSSSPENAVWAIDKVKMNDDINKLENGLNTQIVGGGKNFSTSFVNKLILVRCLAKRPNLLILNDFFDNFSKSDKLDLVSMITKPENKWTLLAVSNDPFVMAACDRIIVLRDGTISSQGTFEDLIKTTELNDLITTKTIE